MTELHTRQRFRQRGCTLTENQTQKRFRLKAVLAKNVAIGRLSHDRISRSARTPPPTFLFPLKPVKEQNIRRCAGLPKPRRSAEWAEPLSPSESPGSVSPQRPLHRWNLLKSIEPSCQQEIQKNLQNAVFVISPQNHGKVYAPAENGFVSKFYFDRVLETRSST